MQPAATLLADSLTLRRDIGDRGGIAWCLEKLAEVTLIAGQRETAPQQDESFRWAVRLFGAAEALRVPVDSKIDAVDQPAYNQHLATLRVELGQETFAAAWNEGQILELEQAITYASAVEPDPPARDTTTAYLKQG